MVTMRVSGAMGAVITAAAAHGLVDVVSREPNLEDVFLAQYGDHAAVPGTRGAPPVTDRERRRGWAGDHRSAGPHAPGPLTRLVGLGTIYGKTVRDSVRAAIVVGAVAGLFMVGTGVPYGAAPEFSTIELRRQFIAGLTALPLALRGLLGEPINIETMGGFLSWRVGNTLPVLLGLWPVIALSGTLAGEAAKGSLDLLASTPQSRRTIALEKLAGHVTAVALAMLILAVTTWAVGAFFGSLPGDEIAFSAALGQVVLYGLMMLAAGGVAFATAPFLGRTRALGVRADRALRAAISSTATPACRRSSTRSTRCRSSSGPPATGRWRA